MDHGVIAALKRGRAARVARIHKLEHDGDRLTHETMTLLHTIFVTTSTATTSTA